MMTRMMYADGHVEETNKEYAFPKFKNESDLSTYFICYIDDNGCPYVERSNWTYDDFLSALFADDDPDNAKNTKEAVEITYLTAEEVENMKRNAIIEYHNYLERENAERLRRRRRIM